jgi:hypothetical protein
MHVLVLCAVIAVASGGDDPFADRMMSYDQGANPSSGYTEPLTSLGSPEHFTGEGIFPGVVSVFNPPWGTDEIVSIGAGGHLVVQFDTPVTDDPANPYGTDLLVFGNTGFMDDGGVAGGLFGNDGGLIEVSADGTTWFLIEGAAADGPLPTIGYLDAGPYDTEPGEVASDFTRPVDPAVGPGEVTGLSYGDILALYAGSGGGTGIDLATVGLTAICCVRITNPGDPKMTPGVEIDAFSDVAPVFAAADLDMDGMVGITDFLILLAAWGPCPDPPATCPADLDGSGDVGITDMLELLGVWG